MSGSEIKLLFSPGILLASPSSSFKYTAEIHTSHSFRLLAFEVQPVAWKEAEDPAHVQEKLLSLTRPFSCLYCLSVFALGLGAECQGTLGKVEHLGVLSFHPPLLGQSLISIYTLRSNWIPVIWLKTVPPAWPEVPPKNNISDLWNVNLIHSDWCDYSKWHFNISGIFVVFRWWPALWLFGTQSSLRFDAAIIRVPKLRSLFFCLLDPASHRYPA